MNKWGLTIPTYLALATIYNIKGSTMFLTAEQANEMSKEECQAHIKKLARKYKLEKPIMEMFTEVWDDLDDIVDTLLHCEDRISAIELSERLKFANDARWGRTGESE